MARGRIYAEDFGGYLKPANAVATMGFFLQQSKEMEMEMKGIGLTACSHEWPYMAFIGYWDKLSKLAAKMFRDSKDRKGGGLDEDGTNSTICFWAQIYAENGTILKKAEAESAIGNWMPAT